jgi:hypothetical protein
LEEDKLALQKEVDALRGELEEEIAKSRELQQHLVRYKRFYEQTHQKFSVEEQRQGWQLEDWLFLLIGGITLFLIIVGVFAVINGFNFLDEPKTPPAFPSYGPEGL